MVRTASEILTKTIRFFAENHPEDIAGLADLIRTNLREFADYPMSEIATSENAETRFSEIAAHYRQKLPRKLALLEPLKERILELRSKHASYDTVRILLAEADIVVSTDTVYRFCRDVIGKTTRSRRSKKEGERKETPQRIPSDSQVTVAPAQPAVSIMKHLADHRQQNEGPWKPRKKGPRIADSKNL